VATLTDSLVSSSARRLPIRKRPDLSARKQQYLGRSYWVVKEPVGLNYFRFQEEEFAILNMLDGDVSLDEIKERFEAEFPPQKITLEELQQFLGMLHRSGLVIAGAGGQGYQLLKRGRERRRKELLAAFTNVLCIRFKGFDPERILNALYPWTGWLFSRAMTVLGLAFALSALVLVLVEFDQFYSKLPGFYQFFSPSNALWLMVVLAVTKIFHEFGHGLTCKRFGGECHEIGVMILVLTPCLYCNVSDSWMLPSKWKRAAIGAAGMYIEVVLAAVATYVWWFSDQESTLAMICLNVMFISSVSTILFNGNPLLRYDGYYILADLMEIPNMRQKATTILSRKMAHWLLGIEPPEDPFLPERNQLLFALYSVAAAFYRWFILAAILWFLYQVFKPYKLQVLGQMLVLVSLYGLVAMPLYKVYKFFHVPGRVDKVKKPRMYTTVGVLAALVLGIVFVPLPYAVMCPLEIRPDGAEAIYVDVTEGGLIELVRVEPGQEVKAGTELAKLSNADVDLEIARLEGRAAQYEKELKGLHRQRHHDPQAYDEIPKIEEALVTVREQLAQREEDRARLRLVAPIDGTVLPPPEIPKREDRDEYLPAWSGTPLDPENRGAYLEQGTLFCRIGDPKRMKAVLLVEQSEVPFVRSKLANEKRAEVEIKLATLPHDVLVSHIPHDGLSDNPLQSAPKSVAAKYGGDLPTVSDPETGQEVPQTTVYEADAPLENPNGLLRTGMRGRGKIHTEWLSLGYRLWRFVSHTFNFKL